MSAVLELTLDMAISGRGRRDCRHAQSARSVKAYWANEAERLRACRLRFSGASA